MTREQIEQMLEEMEIPFRYHHFTQRVVSETQ